MSNKKITHDDLTVVMSQADYGGAVATVTCNVPLDPYSNKPSTFVLQSTQGLDPVEMRGMKRPLVMIYDESGPARGRFHGAYETGNMDRALANFVEDLNEAVLANRIRDMLLGHDLNVHIEALGSALEKPFTGDWRSAWTALVTEVQAIDAQIQVVCQQSLLEQR